MTQLINSKLVLFKLFSDLFAVIRPIFILLFSISASIYAEQLPVRTYTVADGLAHDRIQSIFRDSHGFIWFCTYDGLSRYDGSRFINYGVKDGLLAFSNNIIESRDGTYWIATNGGGVNRFDPEARTKSGNASTLLFTSYSIGDSAVSNRVGTLFEDKIGNIWAGTDGGLFLLNVGDKPDKFHKVDLNIPQIPDSRVEVQDIIEDAEGSIWIATGSGLLRRTPDGAMFHYPLQSEQQSTDYIWALRQDNEGRIWLGYEKGLIVIKPIPLNEILAEKDTSLLWRHLNRKDSTSESTGNRSVNVEPKIAPLPNIAGEAVWYSKADGLTFDNVRAIYQADDGNVWIGTRGGGIYIFNGQKFTNYAAGQGINNNISALVGDINGNIWAGTQTGGVLKIAYSGFRSFGKADGLGSDEVISIFENKANEIFAITNKWTINKFDGKNNFQSVLPNLPPTVLNSGNGRWQIIQDHNGEWWVTTNGFGLFRFPKVENFEDLAKVKPTLYTTENGLADNTISRIFEDSRGDIWLSSYNPPIMMTRWNRASNTFQKFTEADGMPPLNWANVFAENSLGQVWIGMHNGGLLRYQNDNFELFKTTEKNTPGITQGLFIDKNNQVWMATSGDGTGIISQITPDNKIQTNPIPGFKDLSSENLNCFIDDLDGHIYIGTARGIDRVELENGRVRHYSTDDGLPNSEVTVAFRDKQGSLWFGTRKGISHLTAETEQPLAFPVITLIDGIKIANESYPLSGLGQSKINYIELGSNQNQLEFDFFALNFSAGGKLKYRYKVEGSDDDWKLPTEQNSYTVNLTPGNYTFLVVAMMDDGTVAGEPASFDFRILPPVWQRWWFIAIAAILLSAIIYAAYRYRLKQLIEMEKVRTRIATDLHDDIGSSLSQIAILSEVVRQKVGDNGVSEPLNMIADTSREMIDSMGDIVWAINPNKDHLSDLVLRIRRFAGDVLEARDIEHHLYIPEITHDLPLGTDIRREIYLIFKESLNNLVKHSKASKVEIDVTIEHNWFELIIEDNGKGFDVEKEITSLDSMGGNGLISMKRRAEALQGELLIDSEIGRGTKTILRIPIKLPRRTILIR